MSKTPIIFETCRLHGYRPRTIVNASADITLAVFADDKTAGERLTKSCTLEQGKLYLGVSVKAEPIDPFEVAKKLHDQSFSSLNFAGNGLYTMTKFGWSQNDCDTYAKELLAAILVDHPVQLVRSGGQTGFDEAGAKAASWLGVPNVLVFAPANWAFRTADGVDHYNSTQFMARFL